MVFVSVQPSICFQYTSKKWRRNLRFLSHFSSHFIFFLEDQNQRSEIPNLFLSFLSISRSYFEKKTMMVNCRLFTVLFFCFAALSKGLTENHSLDRRSVLAKISAGALCAGLPQPSQAEPSAIASFAAYNIIPDSVNLDPKLEEVDSLSFLKALGSNKEGGSIWLGEHHNSERDHQFQAHCIQSIHAERIKKRNRNPMAIGLEQVQSQFQPVLDDYIAGKLTLDELKNGVEWEKRWMWNFDGYKPIFETAKKLKIKLLALNVDSEDLSLVEKGGYPGLPINRLHKYITDP